MLWVDSRETCFLSCLVHLNDQRSECKGSLGCRNGSTSGLKHQQDIGIALAS